MPTRFARQEEPLPESERGIAISTLGKVILRGWDWLGLTPVGGDRIEGLIDPCDRGPGTPRVGRGPHRNLESGAS